MGTTVRAVPYLGQYPRAKAVSVLAQAWGIRESTAAQRFKPQSETCPWVEVAVGTAALYRAGLIELAERRCAPIDQARILAPSLITTETVNEALIAEQTADGFEDVAQVALVEGMTSAALDTYVRRAEKYAAVLNSTIRICRAYLGRGAA